MKLVIGLGNPGKKYAKTRHNIGFMVLDAFRERLASECDIGDWSLSKKFNAEVAGCTIHNEKIILAKPMTYMNRSGEAAQLLVHFYSVKASDIVVVHDDKDLLLGRIKVEANRGAAGHNGVTSIIEHFGTKDFTRVRIGIAPGDARKMKDTAKYVLGKFGLFEKKSVESVVENAVQELRGILG